MVRCPSGSAGSVVDVTTGKAKGPLDSIEPDSGKTAILFGENLDLTDQVVENYSMIFECRPEVLRGVFNQEGQADIRRSYTKLGGNGSDYLAPLFLGSADLFHHRIDLCNRRSDEAAIIRYQHQIGRNQLEEQVFEKASLVPKGIGEPSHVRIPG